MTDDLAVARHEKTRIDYLDGLRGLGALSVVLHHFVLILTPILGVEAAREAALTDTGPMLLITNGPFYVKVFFMLSGYVLANSVASGHRPLAASLISRYLRLTVPMTVTLIFTWLVGLSLPASAPGNFPTSGTFIPTLTGSIREGLWGVYLHGAPDSNFPLWTMQYELLGSIAIYIVYKVPSRFRLMTLVLLAGLFLFRANGLSFAIGAIFRELHHAGRLRWSNWGWFGGLAYLYFCCNGNLGMDLTDKPQWYSLQHHGFLQAVFFTIGASGLLYTIVTVSFWQACLRTRTCQFLAYVSFGLYLIHYPLLFPLSYLYPDLPGPTPVRLLLLLTLFVSLALACGWLLTVCVDDPLILRLKAWRKGWLSRLSFQVKRA
jgi:peptidoglycan/LPS O-acetylase OafA/YrhL